MPRSSGKATPAGPVIPTEPPEGFGVSLKQLRDLSENRSREELETLGGVDGLAESLRTNLKSGLDAKTDGTGSLAQREQAYGANKFKDVPQKAFFRLFWENLKDPTLVLLMAAALVSTILGVAIKEQREERAWTEGVAIWVAVLVVSSVGAGNDYQKDKQFKKLNAQKDLVEVKVVRNGEERLIENTEVVVGDLMLLDTGDKVVADGIVVKAFGLVNDEASLTGESEPQAKGDEDVFCMSGTQVTEGSGTMLVTAVGEHSEWGKTMALVRTEAADTPLQGSLAWLAAAIGKLGLTVGVLCFVVLMIRWMVENRGFPASKIVEGPLNFFIFAVTIVVVAVPEGLPLAVTISLAYSLKKMMKDNNFVRVLAACETMGGATAICSDKTGTLTENRMTVVEGWFAGKHYGDKVPDMKDLPEAVREHIELNIAMNSKAFLVEHEDGGLEMVGNRTEGALLILLRSWGHSYKTVREKKHNDVANLYGFSSAKKMASVMLNVGSGLRLYNKGAAEIVLQQCTRFIDTDGSTSKMTDAKRRELLDTVTHMADRGLRTLCLSYRDWQGDAHSLPVEAPDEDLTACAIVGIKDPVRQEVPEAVRICHRAGILVRMVTGDNIHTAKHIARECGILTEGGIALEGPKFRTMPEEEVIELLPRLQVLARSSPNDKYDLVKLLKKQGEVVAVTGDGTNDAPALKESDVGLAMGIAGTEVAKEAADIVILDDNFSSIVKSVSWGRSVFSNLRKFLQFQLTINLVALVVAFVAAVTTGETPLNVLQLLWVNLIMDALAALALATEDPSPDLLLETPHGRTEPLINKAMWLHIFVQGFYQIFWLMLIFYGAPAQLKGYDTSPNACPSYTLVNLAAEPRLQLLTAVPVLSGTELVDLCCINGSTADPCLISSGGIYLAGETAVCSANNDGECTITQPQASHFCAGQTDTTNCARYRDFEALYHRGEDELSDREEDAKLATNSVVFNAFIWLQIFNMLNARKIKHEYNIFSGLWKSRAFMYIFVLIIGLQLVIMLTPVSSFFSVTHQNWAEWLFALAVGFGSLFVALATKALVRAGVCGQCLLPSQDHVTDPTDSQLMAKSALEDNDRESAESPNGGSPEADGELRGVQVHPGNGEIQAGPSNPRHHDSATARQFSKQTSRTRYGAVPGNDASSPQ